MTSTSPRQIRSVSSVAAMAVISTLVFSGCGSDDKGKAGSTSQPNGAATSTAPAAPTTTETATNAEAAVKEQGFRHTRGNAVYGLVLENPSADQEAQDVSVTVNAVAANGDVIGTSSETISVIPPGEEFNVGGEIDTGEQKTTSIDVEVQTGDSVAAEHPLPKVSAVRVEKDEFGTLTVRAQVENTLDSTLSSITDVFGVLRNANGKIIGGGQTFPLNDIRPGRKAAIELTFLSGYKNVDSADISVDNEISPDDME